MGQSCMFRFHYLMVSSIFKKITGLANNNSLFTKQIILLAGVLSMKIVGLTQPHHNQTMIKLSTANASQLYHTGQVSTTVCRAVFVKILADSSCNQQYGTFLTLTYLISGCYFRENSWVLSSKVPHVKSIEHGCHQVRGTHQYVAIITKCFVLSRLTRLRLICCLYLLAMIM